MSKSKIFTWAVLCFSAGVLAASRFLWQGSLSLVLMGVFLVLSLLSIKQKRNLAIIFFCMACFVFGIWRLQSSLHNNEFSEVLKKKISLEGTIVEDIDRRPDRQQIVFQPFEYSQNLLLISSLYTNYSYGDKVVVTGKITEPKISGDFDYRAFLQKSNIYGQIYYPKILVLKTGQGNVVVQALLKVKYAFINKISKLLNPVESNLLLGILIGARKGLPQEVLDSFTITGTSHIIAISGYNISILIAAIEVFTKFIGRRFSFVLNVLIVLAFVVISGASASVVRAALMGGLLLFASRSGRLYAITPALCFTLGAMILLNPRLLFWDTGFQLSFLATIGIVYGLPVLEAATESWPKLWGIKSTLFTTFVAIIATTPLILHQFGRFSVVAPLANILILPVVPLTMLFGFLSGLPVLGSGFSLIAHWLLAYILWLVKILAQLPWASVNVEIGELGMVVMYAIILVIYALLRQAFPNQKSVVQYLK